MTTQAPTPTPSKAALAKAQLEALQREAARRRLMPFIKRFNPKYHDGWVHNDVCRRLERFSKAVAEGKSPRLMILFPPRHGKACAVGTLVPTPQGFRRIESLRPGDFVFGRNGLPTRVVAVSEIWRNRELFEAVTDDGASVVVDAEHEWTVRLCRKHLAYKTKTTRYLAERSSPRAPALMTYSPVAYPEAALPIHPYVLGAWLGDGAAAHATLTQGAQDYDFIRTEIELCGHSTTDRSTVGTFGIQDMHVVLRDLGLIRNKRIPEVYQRSSVQQRLALLQGLVDTDGYVAPDGQIEICSVSAELSRHILQLVRSLGVKASLVHGDATLNGRIIGPRYRVMFYMAGAARLPRKAARCRDNARTPHRFLTFRPAGRGDTVCIQVEAEDHQYLVGHGYLLTHNSEIASRNFPPWHLGQYPDHEFIACSYNLSLAMDFSRKVKGILEDPLYHTVFDTRLDPNNQSTESWGVHRQRGGYVAAGIGGPITGKGANCLVIDDPVKNAEEADSADTREKIWEWYLSTAYSRLAPGGGVLVIQCMTGETPVLLADGSEKRLDCVRVGDVVATYENGRLSTSTVAAWKSSGHDYVLKITTSSGKIVRANGRHPFLVSTAEGLKWIRAQNLTTAHKIVAAKDNGGSGRALLVPPKGASCLPSAGGYARRTTRNKNGQTEAAHLPLTQPRAVLHTSSTATASLQRPTPSYTTRKKADAACAASRPLNAPQSIGVTASVSTTATKLAKCGGSYVTGATPVSGIFVPSQSPLPQQSICDFTEEQIVSIVPDGREEVFDVQIDRTENFIANGLVSHNTHWHDDDLAGRLQTMMRDAAAGEGDYIDKFEVIKYPAIAEADEWLNHTTDLIEYDPPTEALAAPDAHYTLLRHRGDALHPERYDIDKLLRIKAQNKGGRWWSALYQQNPVPDDGSYFTKDQFRRAPLPSLKTSNVLIAWDFAISEKKQNDFTVGTVLLQDSDDMVHVADQVRFRSGDAFFIVEAILNLAQKWHNPSLVTGFEDGQIYRAIETLLKKRMRERQFYPPTMVLKPISDKMARGRALQGRMQQGMISFNASGEWYDTLRAEMLRFPAGAHDDQVDSLAWAVQMVVGREPPRKPAGEKTKSWKDKLQSGGVLSHMVA